MKLSKLMFVSILCVTALILFPAQKTMAETPWLALTDGSQLSLDVSIVDYGPDNYHAGFGTSAWIFSGQHYFKNKFALTYQLPLAFFIADDETTLDNDGAIGNIYIGLKVNDLEVRTDKLMGEIGINLPTAPDDNERVLAMTGYSHFDRIETFYPKFFSIHLQGKYQKGLSEVTDLVIAAGGVSMINTDEGDSEFLIDFSVTFKGQFDKLNLGVGLFERYLATDNGSFTENTTEHFGISAVYDTGKIKPGLSIKMPIDDFNDEFVDYIVGLNLIYSLD